jgi:hypothetical protein
MMIGHSPDPYRTFAAAIAPISGVGLILTVVLIAALYRREFIDVPRIDIEKPRVRVNAALLWKSVAAAGAMIVLFFMGLPVSKVAVVTGAILLITRRVKPEKVYREIDWSLLVLFAGLFVVIAGVEKALLTGDILTLVQRLQLDRTGVLTVWSAILSNLVSNVPDARFQTVHFNIDGSAARMADAGDVVHPGGKSDGARFHRQPHRDRTFAAYHQDFLRRVSQSRGSPHAADSLDRGSDLGLTPRGVGDRQVLYARLSMPWNRCAMFQRTE